MVKIIRLFSFSLIFLLLVNCAQVVPPTGGLRDEAPPEIVASIPENGTTNFKASKIYIEFNEFAVLKELKKNLLVSPPLEYSPDMRMRGKKLEIKLEDTLQENTTYTFNFGNAIVDLNEGNAISNFQYVFSTGPEIDTMVISGQVVDAFSRKVDENMLVMLHRLPASDTAFQTDLPNYVGRTDESGNFIISNIKQGFYSIFALQDKNDDYLYDRPDEKIAFLNDSIYITDTLQKIQLATFEQAGEKQYLEKQTAEKASLLLDFKLPLKKFSYRLIKDTAAVQLLQLDFNTSKDSAFFWWNEQNDLKVKMIVADSGSFADTLSFRIDSLPVNSKLKLKTDLSGKQNYFEEIRLAFNRPLQAIDSSKIHLVNTSDSVMVSFLMLQDSLNPQKAILNFNYKPETKYLLTVLPGAFTDIYKKTTDTLTADILFNEATDFGLLKIILEEDNSSQKILQLLDDKGNVKREKIVNKNTVTFEHILPASYRVKLIVDENGNGKWDSGKYSEKRQAEKTYIFDEDINIRKNWDKEITWVIE